MYNPLKPIYILFSFSMQILPLVIFLKYRDNTSTGIGELIDEMIYLQKFHSFSISSVLVSRAWIIFFQNSLCTGITLILPQSVFHIVELIRLLSRTTRCCDIIYGHLHGFVILVILIQLCIWLIRPVRHTYILVVMAFHFDIMWAYIHTLFLL